MYYEGDRDYRHLLSSESASGCLLSWGMYIMIDDIAIPEKKKINCSAFPKMPASILAMGRW